MTPKLKALQNLSSQLPVASQRVAQGQQAARDIQLQQAVKAAPTTANIPAAAQQTGAAAAGQAGQQMIQQAQQQVQMQGQVGQLGLAEQQQQARGNIASLQAGAREQQMDNVTRLARISEDAKRELYDRQMQFAQDEQGRTIFNERQLADFNLATARSEEEFRSRQQQIQQTLQRELETSEHAYNMVMADIDRKYKIAEQRKDQKAQEELAAMRQEAERQMARKKASSANRAAMFQSGGMILGAVAGGVLGSMLAPGGGTALGASMGASAGASVGGAVGGLAASQTEET